MEASFVEKQVKAIDPDGGFKQRMIREMARPAFHAFLRKRLDKMRAIQMKMEVKSLHVRPAVLDKLLHDLILRKRREFIVEADRAKRRLEIPKITTEVRMVCMLAFVWC
jgi:hypothetical protein